MGWGIVVQLGLLALSLAASYYLRPKAGSERAKKAGIGDLNLPRAEEGDAIPLAYGRVRISSPIVVSVSPLVEDSDPDGPPHTEYFISMKLVLCQANHRVGDAVGGGQFISMFVGDKELPIFAAGSLGGDAPQPNVEVHKLASADILGSDGPVPNGTYGSLIFYGGRWDQNRLSYDLWSTEIAAEVPSYRGQVMVSLTGDVPNVAGDLWHIGNSPNLPPYSFVVDNPVTIPGYESVTGPIGNGEANPAAVIYDILTNEWGRLGNPTSSVDIASFVDVATTLRDEEHGISVVVQQPNEAQDLIETILRQIDGVLYEDPITRQYTLRLIREDYVVGDLPVIDPSNVARDHEPPHKPGSLWQETPNEVRVIWTDPAKGYKPGVAPAQDMANVAAQGGRRRTREFQFPWVTNVRLAYHLASRELNFLARPLEKLEVTVNRSMFDLRPGDPFVFNWPAWNNYTNVFRVMDLDAGTLEDGSITITAVQDRFAFPANVFDPDEVGPSTYRPSPIVDRIITETPRWVQLKSFEAGGLANVDAQHGYYLAKPEGFDSRYRVDAEIDGAPLAADSPARPFPGTFEVDLAYDSRTKAGYDTATGLRIRAVVGWTPTAATAFSISTLGLNLIQIGDELLTFEGVTNLGGGDYLLTNVWPAVLDTAPALHAVGDPGYVLPGPQGLGALGSGVFRHGATIDTLTAAAAGSSWTPAEVNPADTIVARSRNLLPYPPAKLLVAGSATPAALTDDEGVTLDWRDRSRIAGTITRPDAADETTEAGVTFDAVAYKGAGAQVSLVVGHSSHTLKVALGAAGHGLLEVGVDARKVVTLPDATTPILGGWQVPTLELLAHHYRNLLLNPRFAEAATIGWTWTVGTPATSTTNALGGAGSYVTTAAAVANLDGYQTRSIAGYDPAGLRATLYFAAVKDPAGGGGADTITVYLYSLDSVGNVLDTATYGPSSPAAWAWQVLDLATLNAATVSIKVRVVMAGGGARALCGFTESHLYVGQVSGQLLVNPSFEANPVAPVESWTETVGTWQGLTATKYGSPTYVRPNDAASAQLQQDITITTGYEGGVAVLRGGRMNDDASDTGKVTIAALGVADVVLASTASAEEAITPTNTWARRLLALELPATTLKVRVRLDATRVSGTPLNACFDDFDLRLHKHLDPDQEITATFDTPMSQRLPSTRYQWLRDFPAVVAPNHAIYDGGLVGRLGPEPLLEAVGVALVGGTLVVDQALPSAVQTTTAYEMPNRTGGSAVQVAPVGTSFANFSSAQDWAALVFFRTREPGAWNGAADLCGRVVGAVGWYLWITLGGRPALTVIGTTGTVTLTGDEVVIHGDLSAAGVTFDSVADTITLVDGLGSYTASTATIGQFRGDDVGRFAFWGSGSGLPPFAGQIARGYMWRGARPTATELRSTLTYLAVPSALSLVASW